MIVQNLIYNRLGNSISLMIDTGTEIVQLHDEVRFSIKGKEVDVFGISNIEKGTVRIGLEIEKETLIFKIYEKNGIFLEVENENREILLRYKEGFEYFIPNDNFNLIMKLLSNKFDFLNSSKIENGYTLKTREGFLKGIAELLIFLKGDRNE